MELDASVYPDREPPASFDGDEERADYVARICGAWDFGVLPDEATFELFAQWRDCFDRFPIEGSPAYHAFRQIFGWPKNGEARIFRAKYEKLDAREGRTDPCDHLI